MTRAAMGRGLAGLGLLLLSLLQSGCLAAFRPVPEQIPTQSIDGAGAHQRLVVVLPGRADDLEGLRRSGIVEAIQQGDPQADVLLVGATPGYYREGRLVERLHDQIVAPARERGYRWIALVGASMGGFGALMYQRVHPGEIDALLLLAPYMGDERLQRDIVDAGGVGGWDPGPLPPLVDRSNATRELWRVVHGWSQRPDAAASVWLVCGIEDRFIAAAQLMAPQLPPGHFLALSGGHAWTVWSAGARTVFAQQVAALEQP